jgi:hypothetical protein
MSRKAERWNIDLGVENREFRKATRAGQPKEGSRIRLPEEVSKKREVTPSPVAEGSQFFISPFASRTRIPVKNKAAGSPAY